MPFSKIPNLLKAKFKFSKYGITLNANKSKVGKGGSWVYADTTQLFKHIQKPLVNCGLDFITTYENNTITVTLYHVETGEYISSSENKTVYNDTMPNAVKISAIDTIIERKLLMKLLGVVEVGRDDFTGEFIMRENLNKPKETIKPSVSASSELDNLDENEEDVNDEKYLKLINAIKPLYNNNKSMIDNFLKEKGVSKVTRLSLADLGELHAKLN